MFNFEKLFSSNLVKINSDSYHFQTPGSINLPYGEFSLGSVRGNPAAFGPFSATQLLGVPVKVELQTMGDYRQTDTAYVYTLKGTGTRQELGHLAEPIEWHLVVTLDSNKQSGTIQFGPSMSELCSPLPVKRYASSTSV